MQEKFYDYKNVELYFKKAYIEPTERRIKLPKNFNIAEHSNPTCGCELQIKSSKIKRRAIAIELIKA